MFDGLYFEYPKLITLIFVFIACDAYCKLRPRALYFPHLTRMQEETSKLRTLLLVLKWFALAMLVLAMMSPVRDKALDLAPEAMRSFVLVVQNSEVVPEYSRDKSYFTTLKKSLDTFIKQLDESSVALVIDNEHSFIASPLTPAKKPLSLILSQLQRGGDGGSLEVAIAEMLSLFKSYEDGRKVALFIVNETRDIGKDALKPWIRRIQEEGIVCYGIVFKEEKKESNEGLIHLAEESGGKYFGLTSEDELATALEEIEEREQVDSFEYQFKEYFYIFPLFLSFFTFLIYIYLQNRRVT